MGSRMGAQNRHRVQTAKIHIRKATQRPPVPKAFTRNFSIQIHPKVALHVITY